MTDVEFLTPSQLTPEFLKPESLGGPTTLVLDDVSDEIDEVKAQVDLVRSEVKADVEAMRAQVDDLKAWMMANLVVASAAE